MNTRKVSTLIPRQHFCGWVTWTPPGSEKGACKGCGDATGDGWKTLAQQLPAVSKPCRCGAPIVNGECLQRITDEGNLETRTRPIAVGNRHATTIGRYAGRPRGVNPWLVVSAALALVLVVGGIGLWLAWPTTPPPPAHPVPADATGKKPMDDAMASLLGLIVVLAALGALVRLGSRTFSGTFSGKMD